MPPKKKARLSSRASVETTEDSLHSGDKTGTHQDDQKARQEYPPDRWTDEQEICLFKGMIKWKPVGMHKHFRMVALSQHLMDHGHLESHTTIPGIWVKLRSLYNLVALDEREDAYGEVNSDDSNPVGESYCKFGLPRIFGDMMEDRKFAPNGSSSPAAPIHHPALNASVSAGRASTVEWIEEPRSSPASIRGSQNRRGGRGSKAMRKSRLQKEVTPKVKRGSKAARDSEEQEERDASDEDNEDDDNGEEDTPSITSRVSYGAAKPKRGGFRGRPRARRGGRRA